LTKAQLIYVLLIASLFAYVLACYKGGLVSGSGFSDGGGL
jgi:hypothetical protein